MEPLLEEVRTKATCVKAKEMATPSNVFIEEVPLQDCSCPENKLFLSNWKVVAAQSKISPGGGATLTVAERKDSHVLLLFGGATRTASFSNDVFLLGSGGSALKLKAKGAIPPARSGHSCVYFKGSVWVFGGQKVTISISDPDAEPEISGQIFDDLWRLDTGSLQWASVSAGADSMPAPARSSHSAHVVGSRMFVIFGSDAGGPTADVLTFDLEGSRWSRLSVSGDAPEAREMHGSCVYADRFIIVSGGRGRDKLMDDTYALDTETSRWIRLGTSPLRCGHSLFVHTAQATAGAGPGSVSSHLGFVGGMDGLAVYRDVMVWATALDTLLRADADGSERKRTGTEGAAAGTGDAASAEHKESRPREGFCAACRGPRGWARAIPANAVSSGPAIDPEQDPWTAPVSDATGPGSRFAHCLTALPPASAAMLAPDTELESQTWLLFGGANGEEDLNDMHLLKLVPARKS